VAGPQRDATEDGVVVQQNAFDTGVLDPEVHARLVADIDHIAAAAGITKDWILRPLAQTVPPDMVEWVKRYRFHAREGRTGLALIGRDIDPTPETAMSAMAGALTRNFILAQVMTLGQVMEALKDGMPPVASCLLIPNFFIEKSQGGGVRQGDVPAYRALFRRLGAGGVVCRG
jgi:hypothetical protein